MITLFGGPTTNVRKVTIALEELNLPYKAHRIVLDRKQQHESWFTALAPNNKIPLISDDATGIDVWESGAILTYLAEQYDKEECILPKTGQARYAAIQGAFFQAAHIGPNLGRLNDQLTAPDEEKIPRMQTLFYQEALRLLNVLDRMITTEQHYLAGDYSIADIMHYPWLKAGLDMKFPELIARQNLVDWLGRVGERQAVERGMASFA